VLTENKITEKPLLAQPPSTDFLKELSPGRLRRHAVHSDNVAVVAAQVLALTDPDWICGLGAQVLVAVDPR